MQESVEGVPNPACSPSVRCFRVQVTTWKISAKQISLRIVGRRRSLTPAGSARLVGTKVSFCLRRRRRQKKKVNSIQYAKTSKYCRCTYCVNRETLTPLFFFFPSIPFCKIPVSKPTKQWNAKELSTRWTPHFLSSSGMERPMSSLSQPDPYVDRYHHRPQISQEDQDVILELLCQCVVSLVPVTLDVSSQVSD